jgi:predicted ATPase
MKKNDKIGFNNFKSFGERLQTFSRKPITLVYGPNSVGKSSLLHFMLYAEYIKNTGQVDLEKTYFAGDPLGLGGFKNFIHKKKAENKISYLLTFNKEADINEYFTPQYSGMKKFEKLGAFAQKIEIEDIVKRVKRYKRKKLNIPTINISTARKYNFAIKYASFTHSRRERNIEKYFNIFEENNSDLLPENKDERKEIFQNCIKSPVALDDILERNDSLAFDSLDKLILFILDFKQLTLNENDVEIGKLAHDIFTMYEFLRKIIDVKEVKLKFEFGIDCNNSHYLLDYFLDNKLIFSYDSLLKKITKNQDSEIVSLFQKNDFLLASVKSNNNPLHDQMLMPKEVLEFIGNKDSQNSYHDFFGGDIGEALCTRAIHALKVGEGNKCSQYIGPLRFYPDRKDLTLQNIRSASDESTRQKIVRSHISIPFIKTSRLIDRYPLWLQKIILSMVALGQIFKLVKSSFKISFHSTSVIDVLNVFRKQKNKISSNSSMNSEKMWSAFIESDSCQKSVNNWLAADSNLKIPYKIEVRHFKKTNLLKRVFGLKPTLGKRLVFLDKRNDTEVTPREMGLGVSQFLPILIATQTLKKYKIFIEQPELHLHPAVQCEIADEIIRSMRAQDNEFILESHSEHLLLRFMKRMRQTADGTIFKDSELALTPDDICLLYIDNNGEMTYVNELELDTDGSLLDPWPNGFFEEGFKERFA